MTRKPRYSSSKLLSELEAALDDKTPLSRSARAVQLDYARQERTGAPEIIQAGQKTAEQVVELARRMVERNGRVLVSRVTDELHSHILEGLQNHHIERPVGSSILRISMPSSQVEPGEGRIAVFTAGTSDLIYAEEIRLVAAEMGCRTRIWADIGVAGLHRLVRPFREAIDDDIDVFVVVAGMDGALPSVIAGLSPVPVIGLPTSTGYGFGGDGQAALMSMLQTCSPGLTVVNIENSVGAAIAAARIANLAHREVDR
jgi:pyridinium-3,5-biscarboxylic acid mononucleotide synthase